MKLSGDIRDVLWGRSPAIRVDGADRSVIFSEKNDVWWAVSAQGTGARHILDEVIAATDIPELNNPEIVADANPARGAR
jgi:hypothetical protein